MDPIQNPNQKNREKKPTLEKAIQGNASVKKPSTGRRFKDELIYDDGTDLKEFFLFDLLAPTIKDVIVDFGKRLLELIFYGRASGKAKSSGGASYVSYSSFNQSRRSDRPIASRTKRIAELDSLEFESRADAENIVDLMNELIDQYGEADVKDLYSLAGITSNGFVDCQFGWRTKFPYDISYYRGTWILHVPRVIELN